MDGINKAPAEVVSVPQSQDAEDKDVKAVSVVEDKHVDQAAVFLKENEHIELLSPEAEKRLKRKIDFLLLPMVGPKYNENR